MNHELSNEYRNISHIRSILKKYNRVSTPSTQHSINKCHTTNSSFLTLINHVDSCVNASSDILDTCIRNQCDIITRLEKLRIQRTPPIPTSPLHPHTPPHQSNHKTSLLPNQHENKHQASQHQNSSWDRLHTNHQLLPYTCINPNERSRTTESFQDTHTSTTPHTLQNQQPPLGSVSTTNRYTDTREIHFYKKLCRYLLIKCHPDKTNHKFLHELLPYIKEFRNHDVNTVYSQHLAFTRMIGLLYVYNALGFHHVKFHNYKNFKKIHQCIHTMTHHVLMIKRTSTLFIWNTLNNQDKDDYIQRTFVL